MDTQPEPPSVQPSPVRVIATPSDGCPLAGCWFEPVTLQGVAAHVGRFAKHVGHFSGVTGYRRLANVLLAGREEVGGEQ